MTRRFLDPADLEPACLCGGLGLLLIVGGTAPGEGAALDPCHRCHGTGVDLVGCTCSPETVADHGCLC